VKKVYNASPSKFDDDEDVRFLKIKDKMNKILNVMEE
jgi:hypothetical protein